jgi:cysteinyl-tRNA synthetase
MAAAVAPGTLDIHSGGIDLAFPHHDNELAQSEAFYECNQWVNYFLHAGHVHIEGLKMSKSLKNFITIKDALSRYTARQLRIMFLQHQWHAPVYYKESSMTTAVAVESTFSNFFMTTAAHLRTASAAPECSVGGEELKLMGQLAKVQKQVHLFLCDNFDTPNVLLQLQELVTGCNVYLQHCRHPNSYVLRMVSGYVGKILRIFGVWEANSDDLSDGGMVGNQSQSKYDSILMPVLTAVALYRDQVRAAARIGGGEQKEDFLRASDELRDKLGQFGVVFEDQAGGKGTLVKLMDPAAVAKQRSEAADREAEKLARKLEMAKINETKLAAKIAKAQVIPAEMFRDPSLYSQWDENGVPTHDATGLELGKNARKKLLKEFEVQAELHQKFLDGNL